jgi:S-(hydroxymethyl)glutathione dehydrogenase/alcohol dehydrogenase
MRDHIVELPIPLVLGHEAAGIVEAVGSDVTAVGPGDPVVTAPGGYCGNCDWCLRGRSYLCADAKWARPAGQPPRLRSGEEGIFQLSGLASFAEAMLVHESAVIKLPEAMPLDRAALLGCGVATGLGAALITAGVQLGQTVAVIGCGGVGISAIQGARLAHASAIIAIDRVDAKLDLARELGATHTINTADQEPLETVKHWFPAGLDHAIEAIGRGETIEMACGLVGTRGTVTVAGFAPADAKITLPAQWMLLGERRLQGSLMGSNRFRLELPLYAELYLRGELKLDEMISDRVTLDQVNDAMDGFDGSVSARTVITF